MRESAIYHVQWVKATHLCFECWKEVSRSHNHGNSKMTIEAMVGRDYRCDQCGAFNTVRDGPGRLDIMDVWQSDSWQQRQDLERMKAIGRGEKQ